MNASEKPPTFSKASGILLCIEGVKVMRLVLHFQASAVDHESPNQPSILAATNTERKTRNKLEIPHFERSDRNQHSTHTPTSI